MMKLDYLRSIAAIAIMTVAAPILSQPIAKPAVSAPSFAVPAANISYADVADLVTISPLILDAQVRKVTKVPAEQAVGVPANMQRMLIDADVLALLRGDGGFAGTARFLLDVPKDAKPQTEKNALFSAG
jgi:hypothetical protein